jgi:hypothetical protein
VPSVCSASSPSGWAKATKAATSTQAECLIPRSRRGCSLTARIASGLVQPRRSQTFSIPSVHAGLGHDSRPVRQGSTGVLRALRVSRPSARSSCPSRTGDTGTPRKTTSARGSHTRSRRVSGEARAYSGVPRVSFRNSRRGRARGERAGSLAGRTVRRWHEMSEGLRSTKRPTSATG